MVCFVALVLSFAWTSLAAAQSVTLAWDPSPTTDVTGYVVSYGTQPGSYTSTVQLGVTTTVTINQLTPGQTYYFGVQARNPYGLSAYASEVSTTIPGLPSPPPPPPTLTAIGSPSDIQVVSFKDNSDSYADLLLYNHVNGMWAIKHGNSTGQFDLARSGGWAVGWQIHVADFNGDGVDDIFLYSAATGVWVKAIKTGSAFTYFSQRWAAGLSVYIVEFNGDGRADVFAYDAAASGAWSMCISTGTGTSGFSCATGGWRSGWQILPADFNADNLTDFLLYDPVAGIFVKAVTRGTGIFSYYSGGWAGGWVPIVAKLNSDQRDDVLLYNPTTGIFVRCTSTGDGTGAFSYVSGGWAPGWSVRPADFNANGLTDLFLYNSSGVWVKVINTGTAFTYVGGGWRLWESSIVDLNGDGNSDVFLYDRPSGVWVRAVTNSAGQFVYNSGSLVE